MAADRPLRSCRCPGAQICAWLLLRPHPAPSPAYWPPQSSGCSIVGFSSPAIGCGCVTSATLAAHRTWQSSAVAAQLQAMHSTLLASSWWSPTDIAPMCWPPSRPPIRPLARFRREDRIEGAHRGPAWKCAVGARAALLPWGWAIGGLPALVRCSPWVVSDRHREKCGMRGEGSETPILAIGGILKRIDSYCHNPRGFYFVTLVCPLVSEFGSVQLSSRRYQRHPAVAGCRPAHAGPIRSGWRDSSAGAASGAIRADSQTLAIQRTGRVQFQLRWFARWRAALKSSVSRQRNSVQRN